MNSIAILGAGEVGATLAWLLAEREIGRRVIIVDPDEGKARGKALDITQAGPVEGFDTRVDGCAALKDAQPFDVLVVADPPEMMNETLSEARAGDLARSLIPEVGRGFLVVAARHASSIVEAVVRRGFPRERVVGSLPLAVAAAVSHRLGVELKVEPGRVALGLLGDPPTRNVVPQASVVVGGIPADRLAATALRRALESLHREPGRPVLGPVALAHAARRVLHAVHASRGTILPVSVWLDGEYGHRGLALAVPAVLGDGRVQRVLEVPLDPVDRVALDTAAQRREQAR